MAIEISEALGAKYAEKLARANTADIAHTPASIRDEFLSRHERSPNTHRAYKRALDAFGGFFASFNLDLFGLDRGKVGVYLEYLLDEKAGAQKVNQHFAAIRGFYKTAIEFSESTGVLKDPAAGISLPALSKVTSSKGLTIEQAVRLKRAVRAMPRESDALKATAVVEVLLTTGVRAQELVGADSEGFDTSDSWALLDVVRKGGARDRVEMPPATGDVVEDLLDGRRVGPVILSRKGARETVQGLERLMHRVAAKQGLQDFEDRLYPHNLRVAFATYCYAAGVPLLEIMRKMGHAKQETTIRYIRMSERISPGDAKRILGLS